MVVYFGIFIEKDQVGIGDFQVVGSYIGVVVIVFFSDVGYRQGGLVFRVFNFKVIGIGYFKSLKIEE